MSDNRAKWIEAIVAISSFGVGCVYGSFVEFQHQKTIYEVLRNTSAIIFGVVGAWYAVITPMYLGSEDKNGKKSKYARALLKSLLIPIKYAIYILCITILFQLFYPISSIIEINYETRIILKAISFGLVCSLSVLMLFTLIRSLIPNDFIQTDIDIMNERMDYEDRLKKNTHKE